VTGQPGTSVTFSRERLQTPCGFWIVPNVWVPLLFRIAFTMNTDAIQVIESSEEEEEQPDSSQVSI